MSLFQPFHAKAPAHATLNRESLTIGANPTPGSSPPVFRSTQAVRLRTSGTARQTKLPTSQELAALVAPYAERYKGALVIGITNGLSHSVQGVQPISPANAATADGDTIFELASVTKVITGLLLADMVTRGEVHLNDPVQKWLPPGVTVPIYRGQSITLENLATHSSGLPRAPAGRVLSENFPTRRMHMFLNQYSLQYAPGTRYLYSNLGVTLLGEALARAAKEEDYEQLLNKRIGTVLHMENTRIKLNQQQKLHFAGGLDARQKPLPHNGLFGCGASGALKSSANDLLKLIDAYLAPDTVPPLSKGLRLSMVRRAAGGKNEQIALGWFFSKVTGNYYKNGLLPGFRTYIAFSPKNHFGVVVLGASDAYEATTIGERIMRQL